MQEFRTRKNGFLAGAALLAVLTGCGGEPGDTGGSPLSAESTSPEVALATQHNADVCLHNYAAKRGWSTTRAPQFDTIWNQWIAPAIAWTGVNWETENLNIHDNNVCDESTVWADFFISWPVWAAKPWTCSASCNLEGDGCWGKRAAGSGSASDEPTACNNAKREATQSAPRGCYARHCQCDCTH